MRRYCIMRRCIIGGNWKMQVPTIKESVALAKNLTTLVEKLENNTNIDVFIAPSYNALFSVGAELKGSIIKLGAQNVSSYEKGAFTGEVSVNGLIESECTYVILGHSERRHIFKEDDDLIRAKMLMVLEKNLKVVLCIGENAKERETGKTEAIITSQLKKCFHDINDSFLKNVIIAYEPVWAINNKYLNPGMDIKPATPAEANAAHQIIRKWFQHTYNKTIAENIQIMYGGSMSSKECEKLLTLDDVDGGLIGTASLSPEEFTTILKTAITLSSN